MLRGTRIIRGQEAQKYAYVCDTVRRFLHR